MRIWQTRIDGKPSYIEENGAIAVDDCGNIYNQKLEIVGEYDFDTKKHTFIQVLLWYSH